MRRRIGEIVRELLEAQGEHSVTFGDLDLLHAISHAAGHKQDRHPLNIMKAVLDALSRDCKQPGAAMAQYWGRWGLRGQLCRGFWIKGTEPETWKS